MGCRLQLVQRPFMSRLSLLLRADSQQLPLPTPSGPWQALLPRWDTGPEPGCAGLAVSLRQGLALGPVAEFPRAPSSAAFRPSPSPAGYDQGPSPH